MFVFPDILCDICLLINMFNFSDTGQILKYFTGIIIAVLLTRKCVVGKVDFTETSIDLEVGNVYSEEHKNQPYMKTNRSLSFLD